jgi:hypothetical protein
VISSTAATIVAGKTVGHRAKAGKICEHRYRGDMTGVEVRREARENEGKIFAEAEKCGKQLRRHKKSPVT